MNREYGGKTEGDIRRQCDVRSEERPLEENPGSNIGCQGRWSSSTFGQTETKDIDTYVQNATEAQCFRCGLINKF